MAHLARTERAALCDTLLDVGPDAPTLCGSWTAAQLAAHLVVREGRPDQAAGILLAPLAGRTERAMTRLVERTPYPRLVERVRTGPPAWHPTRVRAVDDKVNLVEMFVHHEDLRRAGAGTDPRRLSPEMTSALGARLSAMAPLLLRKLSGIDVQLVTSRMRKRVGPGTGPVVEVHGHPGEVLLFLFGRQEVAQVELVGDEASVATLCNADLGV